MGDSSKAPPKVHYTSEVNSLLDLQSEFLRKKKEANALKPSPTGLVNRTKNNIFALTKAEKEEKQNAREARAARIRRGEEALRKEEEEYAKRRRILEEKSAIYDRMSKGETLVHEDGRDAEFLVNFQLKKQEIEERMARESAASTSRDEDQYEESETPLVVHYDPTEEKGRVFGPSHVSLAAATEEERLRKMAEIKKLSEETAVNRLRYQKTLRAKRAEERKRLNRLRARKGLPPLESSSESEPEQEPMPEVDLSDIPLPSETTAEQEQPAPTNKTTYGIREWDRGKVGYTRWISAERDKRDDEFRPPSFYYDSK